MDVDADANANANADAGGGGGGGGGGRVVHKLFWISSRRAKHGCPP